jgi:hypothetical protein
MQGLHQAVKLGPPHPDLGIGLLLLESQYLLSRIQKRLAIPLQCSQGELGKLSFKLALKAL